MIAIDLFAGAGGMAYGAAMAGIETKLAVESDAHAAKTYAFNHPNTTLFISDIKKLKKINIACCGKQKIVLGGPPCQGFSTSNQKNRNIKNKNNWLFWEFIKIVKLWKPQWIVFENVKGILTTASGYFFDQIISNFENLNYKVSHWVLNASDFGVPQYRERLFIIGSLEGISVDAPQPLSEKHITVKQALSGLPDLQNGSFATTMPYKTKKCSSYAKKMRGKLEESSNHLVTKNLPYILKRYAHIPQGGNWQNIPKRLMKNYSDTNKCHTGIYHRLSEDMPSVVIGNYRKNMLIHPHQDRGLSVREAARLQSFPDSYEFKGSIGFQQQQVGNAVPPLLAKAVFSVLCNCKGHK